MANFVVAITGGIGSGKTAVSDRFADHGILISDMDIASRQVVEPGRPALAEISGRFGASMIAEDGSLDRRALREHIFQHPDERRWLERLLHPLINQLVAEQLRDAASPYAMVVNPLLRRKDRYVDRVLVVDVPVEVQIERTMQRDEVPREQAKAIVESQIDRDSRLGLADDIVSNNGDLAALDEQVSRLHETYVALSECV